MTTRNLKADALLLLAAAVWGTAFVAQRKGMESMGPWTFNAARFALGTLVLLPLWHRGERSRQPIRLAGKLGAGLVIGLVLFGGSSLQQIGLVTTTAGKAGFITGLYVILVPILGLALGRHTSPGAWLGAGVALGGLYLLSVTSGFRMELGDALVLTSAVFWAGHILLLDRWSYRIPTFQLATLQSAVCAVLSLLGALAWEEIHLASLWAGALPIVYGGVLSVGLAYTLQVNAQRKAPPNARRHSAELGGRLRRPVKRGSVLDIDL